MARLTGTTVDDLRLLNPALTRLMTPPNYPDFELRVPPGTGEPFAVAFAGLPVTERIPWKNHTVRKGETLAAIARRYGVSVSQVRQANTLPPGSALKAGMNLQIPTYMAAPSGGHGDILRASSRDRSRTGGKTVVKVRSGDTLTSIASRYRTSVANLKEWNHLSSNTIHVGDKLVVYARQEAEAGVVAGARPAGKGGAAGQKVAAASVVPGAGGSPAKETQGGPGRTYRVRKGDTLYRIATRMSTSVEAICSLNNLSASDTLHPGTLLLIGR